MLLYTRKKYNSHLTCNSQHAAELIYVQIDRGISDQMSESNMADPQRCTDQPKKAKMEAEKYSVRPLIENDRARSSL